jgi:Flp pilus assembly protein TadD
LLYLGRAHYRAGNYDAALSAFEQARALDRTVVNIYSHLGLTYEKLGQVTLALLTYEQGLDLSPTNPYLNMVAGDLYARLGELQKAYCCYVQVVEHGADQSSRERASQRLVSLGTFARAQTCDGR